MKRWMLVGLVLFVGAVYVGFLYTRESKPDRESTTPAGLRVLPASGRPAKAPSFVGSPLNYRRSSTDPSLQPTNNTAFYTHVSNYIQERVGTNRAAIIWPNTPVGKSTNSAQEVEANDQKMKDYFKSQGLYQDVAEREAKLKELAEQVRVGMTFEETVRILGKPHLVATERKYGSLKAFGPGTLEDLKGHEDGAILVYSPQDEPRYRGAIGGYAGPYKQLQIELDASARIRTLTWVYSK